ncbi:hypothetical protein IEQ34_019589 [Dendrobium chrysotoxum]|uniref:Uncharacterized protein n=1 Tax=Dendrobium chrysotoxum TaxID=161865 RepID=A0AAV7G846_DENCH|nr:hypothetical protein IEQ34_019589 [Dendrobium chrysotoxum]
MVLLITVLAIAEFNFMLSQFIFSGSQALGIPLMSTANPIQRISPPLVLIAPHIFFPVAIRWGEFSITLSPFCSSRLSLLQFSFPASTRTRI